MIEKENAENKNSELTFKQAKKECTESNSCNRCRFNNTDGIGCDLRDFYGSHPNESEWMNGSFNDEQINNT